MEAWFRGYIGIYVRRRGARISTFDDVTHARIDLRLARSCPWFISVSLCGAASGGAVVYRFSNTRLSLV